MKQSIFIHAFLRLSGTLLLMVFPSMAQVVGDLDGMNPRIFIEYEKVPDGIVQGIGGQYGTSSFSGSCTVPIGGDFSFNSGGFSGYRIFINAGAARTTTRLGAMDRSVRFNTVRGGMTGILASESKNIYQLSMMLGMVEDNATITTPRVRITTVGIGTYRISGDFTFLYGLAYTYLFGDGKLLPMGGFRWRIANQWNLNFMLPLSLGLSYRPDDDAMFRITFSPAGDKMHFENTGSFTDAGDIITMRITQIRVRADARMKISQSIDLHVSAGVLGARNITFLSDNVELLTGEVERRGFVSLGLSFRLDDTMFDDWFE